MSTVADLSDSLLKIRAVTQFWDSSIAESVDPTRSDGCPHLHPDLGRSPHSLYT